MHEYPSIVSIKIYRSSHFCGGTLVNRNTILTAAHCVYNFKHYSSSMLQQYGIVAVMGEHELNRASGKERVVPITQIIIPAAYNSPSAFVRGNDIALLKLARNVVEEDHVKMVQVPRQGMEPSSPGQQCTVVGWGSMDPRGGSVAHVLQKADLTIMSNNDCGNVFYYTRNNPSNVCAGSGRLSTSACKGDSGGPLFCRNSNGIVQVGVVSYGKVPCGQSHTPTVFTRVSNFASWMNSYL